MFSQCEKNVWINGGQYSMLTEIEISLIFFETNEIFLFRSALTIDHLRTTHFFRIVKTCEYLEEIF